jgi:hypothetical protein
MTISSRKYTHEDFPRLQDALAAWRRAAGRAATATSVTLRTVSTRGCVAFGWRGSWCGSGSSGIVGVAICLRFGAAFDVFTDPGLRGPARVGDAAVGVRDDGSPHAEARVASGGSSPMSTGATTVRPAPGRRG